MNKKYYIDRIVQEVGLDALLKSVSDDIDAVIETMESAGCTGSCQFMKDGLPDCQRCSQWSRDE